MTTLTPPDTTPLRYRPVDGRYDEGYTSVGDVRPHWRELLGALGALGHDELAARRREADRLLRNEGAAHVVYDDAGGERRAWELDPVPLLVDSSEWALVESGLQQRAELLDAVLADLYGSRTLVRRGLIPPAFVHAHAGFLRPLAAPPTESAHRPPHLVLIAADLGRDADGHPMVLADRTQAPSGLGYSLLNRIVQSRVLPSTYRDAQAHRLARFFRTLRTRLDALAATASIDGDGRVVVLSPGAANESYFEHGWLASYLGFALAEGSDLQVRNNRLWLRSLTGDEPVDVILRRLDDDYCDPLELRPDSQLGVAGLVECARRGRVALANPLGAGVLENPGLAARLPAICRALFGQDLRLSGPPTWWCGNPTERAHVLANLERLVLRPIDRIRRPLRVDGATLDSAQLAAWRDRLLNEGEFWVAQELAPLATAPTLVDGDRLEPRPVVLRSFVLARDDDFVVMPGGLTRVGPDLDATVVSLQQGALTKDTWVLSSEPEPAQSTWVPTLDAPPLTDVATPVSLPARVADNLYWIGRHAERAEGLVRLLQAILARLDAPVTATPDATDEALGALLDVLAITTGTYAPATGVAGPDGAGRSGVDVRVLGAMLDRTAPGSLVSGLQSLVDASYAVREQLSGDAWSAVEDIGEVLADLAVEPPATLVAAQAALGALLRALLAFAGLIAESLMRDLTWRFLDAGRRIERTMQLCITLSATVVPARSDNVQDLLSESTLRIAESIVTYRRRATVQPGLASVLDLLLFDTTNPRSVAFGLGRLDEHLAALPHSAAPHLPNPEERHVIAATAAVRVADPADLSVLDAATAQRTGLRLLLDTVYAELAAASDAITSTYFTVATGTQLAEAES